MRSLYNYWQRGGKPEKDYPITFYEVSGPDGSKPGYRICSNMASFIDERTRSSNGFRVFSQLIDLITWDGNGKEVSQKPVFAKNLTWNDGESAVSLAPFADSYQSHVAALKAPLGSIRRFQQQDTARVDDWYHSVGFDRNEALSRVSNSAASKQLPKFPNNIQAAIDRQGCNGLVSGVCHTHLTSLVGCLDAHVNSYYDAYRAFFTDEQFIDPKVAQLAVPWQMYSLTGMAHLRLAQEEVVMAKCWQVGIEALELQNQMSNVPVDDTTFRQSYAASMHKSEQSFGIAERFRKLTLTHGPENWKDISFADILKDIESNRLQGETTWDTDERSDLPEIPYGWLVPRTIAAQHSYHGELIESEEDEIETQDIAEAPAVQGDAADAATATSSRGKNQKRNAARRRAKRNRAPMASGSTQDP